MTGSTKIWFAVYTKARMELWARSNLRERGHEVYLPLYLRQRRHARKTDWVSAPLFPRYLFVARSPIKSNHRSIRSTPGVIDLVKFGDRPATVENAVIQEIQARENESGHVQLVDPKSLVPGEQVRMHGGAMTNHVGLFERQCDSGRVVVLLNLLGREVRVRAPSDIISRSL